MPRLLVPAMLLVLAVPPAPALPLPQDDAGSGRDAPDHPADDVRIEPDQGYFGATPPPDDGDHYAFSGAAGQVVRVSLGVHTGPFCAMVVDAEGDPLPSACAIGPLGSVVHEATLPAGGTWYVRVPNLAKAYRFGFTLDAAPLAPTS